MIAEQAIAHRVSAAEPERAPSLAADAVMAATLFAVDPIGLGGIAAIAGVHSPREQWLEGVKAMLAPSTPLGRLPAGIADDALLGGVDLAQTLKAGRPIIQKGLLAATDGGLLVIPMAERMPATTAARIAQALDQRSVAVERDGIARRLPARFGIIAFDEGVDADERMPRLLLDRLAFQLDLDAIAARALALEDFDPVAAGEARARLDSVAPAPDAVLEALVGTAVAFGIASVTAPLLALRVARAAAALAGRTRIEAEDATLAARLVLAPRALHLPSDGAEAPSEANPEPPPERPQSEASDAEADSDTTEPLPSLEEIMLAAVKAALPDGLLASLRAGAAARGASQRQGSGSAEACLTRGRPKGVRLSGRRSGGRLALVETLRAAAPWQPLRRSERQRAGDGGRHANRVDVRPEDFRIRTYVQRRESTVVFAVDASGSAAFHRLAEAKGAVELLLAQAYSARTYAALVAFRGSRADLLLPATRSLSRAKSLLAELPGGGGTPLAAGIDLAMTTALAERKRGREPLIVFLSDGRANIARDGMAARRLAGDEALAAARQLAGQRLNAIFVDTAPRPQGEAAALAEAMGGRYLALPYVEATSVADMVRAAIPAAGSAAFRAR